MMITYNYDTWADCMIYSPNAAYIKDTLRGKVTDIQLIISWDYSDLSAQPSYGMFDVHEYKHLFEIPYENILCLIWIEELVTDPDSVTNSSWTYRLAGLWSE